MAPLVAMVAWGGFAFFRAGPRDVGQPAPAFALEDLKGSETLRSEDLRGEPYVLNFWASWCLPCREEAPTLAKVAADSEAPPRLIGINMLDGRSDALRFVEEFDVDYLNLRDPGRVFRRFKVTGAPETIFVSADGRIVGRYVGAIDETTLRRLMKELRTVGPDDVLEISGRGTSVSVP